MVGQDSGSAPESAARRLGEGPLGAQIGIGHSPHDASIARVRGATDGYAADVDERVMYQGHQYHT
jgi:hypothetical protein